MRSYRYFGQSKCFIKMGCGWLLRWAVAGPIVAQIFKDGAAINERIHIHHEDTHSFEQKFRTDLDSLYSAFLDFGNPFKEEKVMMEEASSHLVKQAGQNAVAESG